MKKLAVFALAAVLAAFLFAGCQATDSSAALETSGAAGTQTAAVDESETTRNENAGTNKTASANFTVTPAPAQTSDELAKLREGKNTARLIVCDDEVVFTKDTLVRNGKFYFAASDIDSFLLSYDRFGAYERSDGEAQGMPEIAISSSLGRENGKLEFVAWEEVFTVPAEPIEDEYMVSLDDVAAALKSADMETDAENGYIRLYDSATRINLSDYEGKEVKVMMSGEGQIGIVKDNEVYAPITGTFENLLGAGGGKNAPFASSWDETTLTAKISNRWSSVTVKAGEVDFTADGNPKTAIAPLQRINGQYMLPLRSVAKALGAEAVWNKETETLSVFYASIVSMSPAN